MVDSGERSHSGTRHIPSLLSAMLRASDGILELLPIATFICDAEGTILQYNRHAVAVWGGAPSPGQTHEQFRETARFFDLDGMPAERSLVAEVLATGKPVRDVERIVEHADGSTLIVSVNIDPLRNAKGELVGAVNCFLDITARKRADAALERSRLHALEQDQRLAATYEHAAIGISEVDPTDVFCASMNRFVPSPASVAKNFWPADCFVTPIPTMPIPIGRHFASKPPANLNFIQSRSDSFGATTA